MTSSVLIIDNSDNARDLIIRALSGVSLFDHYREAKDGIEGIKSLISAKADLIICDLEMLRMDGFKFINMVNSRQDLRDIPIIMLTSREDSVLKIKGLEQGASAYVAKPFDGGELVAQVKVQLKIKDLQNELKKSDEQLKELSNTDPLTHLYNRWCLTKALNSVLLRVERAGNILTLIILDIDYFKKINDTYGHQNGDRVLSAIAETIQMHLRCYDIAERYGGEEFVLVLPGTSLADGEEVAERLRKEIESLSFEPQLDKLSVTISLGVALFP
jgi:diguanylate cyclase (GGDEF)-like protein